MSGSNGNGNGHTDYILLTAETRRARKLYRCVHCTEKITPGEPHVYTSGVYDGRVCDDRWHLECREAVERDFRDQDQEWEKWEPGAYRRGTVLPIQKHAHFRLQYHDPGSQNGGRNSAKTRSRQSRGHPD